MKYGLEFAGARRVRRTWRGTVLTVVTLLTVSALVGWLLHLVRRAATRGDVMPRLPGVAMWPVSGVIAWGVVTLCVVLLVGLAVAGWRELTPREGGETGRLGDRETVRRGDGETQAGSLSHVVDPLATTRLVFEIMPASLCRADAESILRAMAAEVLLVTNMVASARRTMCVDDYDDALAGAEKRLRQVRVSCVELAGRFEAQDGEGVAA